MKIGLVTLLIFCLLLNGCSTHSTDSYDAVKGFQIAQRLAYYDWTVAPVEEYFTVEELKWLETHKHAIESDITQFITNYSTPAVLLAGHLKLKFCFPILRTMLLSLRSPCGESGGDGADYTKAETYLRDSMYPYHIMYIEAIESITGLPIHEAIIPKSPEIKRLQYYAEQASVKSSSSEPWCAKWLLMKLKLPSDECCEKDEKIDIVPMGIIDSNIYTREMQGHFETPHYAVFAIVHCEVHGGYAPYSQYKTDYPLEIPDTTFGGYPVYNDGNTIHVKMTEHRETDLEGVVINALAKFHTEVVFIGFCRQGKYKFNVNGFEKEFSVGNIK